MNDDRDFRGAPLRDPFWRNPAGPRPSLGQIGLQQFAPFLINSLSWSYTSELVTALRAHDMTTTRMRALAVLSLSSPLTINELSLYALTEQSTMSRTLDVLEEQGLIVRKARPEDLRVRDVDITKAGRDAFARVWPSMYDLLLKMLEGVDIEEYKSFIATLHKMLHNIRNYGA